MRATIEPHFVLPSAHQDMAHAPPFRHAGSQRSIRTWIHIVIDSLVQAHATHAAYCLLVERGVAPSIAIRAAFELKDEALDPAGVADVVPDMGRELERQQ